MKENQDDGIIVDDFTKMLRELDEDKPQKG